MNRSADPDPARRGFIPSAAVLLLAGLVAGRAMAGSFCAVDGPESILTCLKKAYAERDAEIIGEILADDFVFKIGSRGSPKDKTWNLMVYAKFFGDSTTRNLSVEFAPNYRITPVPGEGTWTIDSLTVITRYDSTKDGDPRHFDLATQNNRLKIRLVETPEPHYEIFHWLQPFTRR